MSEDVDTSSFQHLVPDCKGQWIDVSTLMERSFVCGECRAHRSLRQPGDPPAAQHSVEQPHRHRVSAWVAIGLIVVIVVIVSIGIFGGTHD